MSNDEHGTAERVAALERELAALRAELAALARPEPAPSAAAAAVPAEASATTRRALLGRVGVLAAGTAAGLVATGVTAAPAAAANGQGLVLGQANGSTALTETNFLGATPGAAFTFQVGNDLTAATSPVGSALAGWVTGGATSGAVAGVFGHSAVAGGIGVAATTVNGDAPAVQARSDYGPTLRLLAGVGAPSTLPPANGTWVTGDLLRSADGGLWYCQAGGAGPASRWVRLSAGGLNVLATPQRAYDTRNGAGVFTGDDTRVVSLAAAGVPVGAAAVLLNITVTDTAGFGYVQVYSAALGGPPAASNLNWYAGGQIVANNATAAVDASARVKITTQGGSAHLIVDVFGYYG